jgi:hypothetical protein
MNLVKTYSLIIVLTLMSWVSVYLLSQIEPLPETTHVMRAWYGVCSSVCGLFAIGLLGCSMFNLIYKEEEEE